MHIVGYTYKADQYCPAHIVAQLPANSISPAAHEMEPGDVLDQLAAYLGIDREDEHTFDSDDFPKVIFSSSVSDDDVCDHCHEYIY